MKYILLIGLIFPSLSFAMMDHNHSKTLKPTHHTEAHSMMNSEHDSSNNPHYMHHGDLKGNPTPSSQAYVHASHVMHSGMDIEFTGNADIDFLRGMIPHHQGAVDMANIQLEHGNNGLLKKLTQAVIRAQEREIAFMERRLAVLEREWNGNINPRNPSVRANKHVNHKMHTGMDITYSGNADIDFVEGMIPHHQGAIDMAGVVLRYGSDPNVRFLAQAIITDQQREIRWMKRWLHRLNLLRMGR